VSEDQDLLFVLGGPKTASTSLCGLLNSHPDVFVMCEVFFNNGRISRYGTKLVKAHPEFMPCFFQADGAGFLENYRRGHALLRAKGYANRYFGDKFVNMDSNYADTYRDCRVIYSVRRLPEWIAKDSVRGLFPLDLNTVPFAVQYAKHFVESFLLPRVHHVRMESFIGDNAGTVRNIWKFLEIDPSARAEFWWETIGNYAPGDPKRALNWWRGHASSAVEPHENDTRAEIRPNAFWSEILPIFNKYYDGGSAQFSRPEIEADLKQLHGMIERYHQPFDTCFDLAASQSHNPRIRKQRDSAKAHPIGRLLKAVGLK
jgi:hypothetical protein